jgi:SAM-dependent methyltransferase
VTLPAMDTRLRDARAYAYENPREDVQALVPRGVKRVLDLGCSSGALGAALKERDGAEVVGIELEAEYAADAADRLDRVLVGNLEEIAARDDLAQDLGRFDCLIAADVLEHLVDPWTALKRFAALLEPDGTAVISLPNVRHWETFWQLGRHGRWPRRGEGIFDRTHLRWFTIGDGYDLCLEAGLEPYDVSRQIRVKPHVSNWDKWGGRLERVPGLRGLITFQFVIAARPKRG